MSVHYNGRSQSSDGESLPDDVFHDDSNVGVASGSQAPPTGSVPPPKPPRVGGSSGGIASFINKNTKKLKKRTSSEDLEESSKSVSDSKGGGGRRWSFKSGKSKRQQSVPVDMKLAESKGQSRTENGSVSSLTGNETGLSSSMSVSPLPPPDNHDTAPTEATPTTNITKPRPLASSSTHNNNTNMDLETVHENAVSADSRPPVKPVRQTTVPSRQISTGTSEESKPSPKPRQKQHARTKLFSDSQVLNDDTKGSSSLMQGEGGEKSGGGGSSSKGPGKDTLERDNMLLREQIKLLKGQNQKLKEQNKHYRCKIQDSGEFVTPATSSASHSESASPALISPRESLPSSHGSSREPSSSPARDVFERNHPRMSDSTTVATSGEMSEDREKRDENSRLSGNQDDLENSEESNDVPQSLPFSSDVRGSTVASVPKGDGWRASSVPDMITSKQKPIPIPRSGTVSVGGSSGAVVKAGSEDKMTRGFVVKKGKTVDVGDSVPSNTEGSVRLESVVSKVESPVPKPRVNTNLSQVYADKANDDCSTSEKSQGNLQANDDSNKEKEKEKSNARRTLETLLPHLPKQTATSKPPPHLRSMSTQDTETKKEPLTPRAASLSPLRKVGMVTLGSSLAEKGGVISESGAEGRESETKMESGLERVDEERAVQDGGEVEREEREEREKERTVSDLSKSGGPREEEREEEDERTESMSSSKSFTSSISSVGKGSPITKPLPPTPAAVVAKSPSATSTKPLPLTPPTITKPLPPAPQSSNTKPLPCPPTPTSSTAKSSSPPAKPLPPTPPTSTSPPAKPLPPTPPTTSPVPAKPLPPTPTTTTSKTLAPIKVGVSSTSSPPTTTSSPPNSATGSKDTTGILSPRTPTSRGVGTGYKKITIQSDTSWINRRKQTDSKESTDGSTVATKLATPGPVNTSSQSSTSSITSPTGGAQLSRPHAPYRSHAILPTPSPTAGKTFITPSVGYSGPPSTAEAKPMGPPGKLLPPKLVVNSRTRTESVASAEPSSSKKGGAKGAADKESQFLRSTSEENLALVGNSKVKGQSKGGLFSRSGTKKDVGPPKKPSRPWLRGKEKGSPPNPRPQSALITNNGPAGDRGFTGSCTVSTMPRGPPPEDNAKYSPKSARRKKAASEQDLYHGRKSKGKFLGRLRAKSGQSGAPPLEEEPEGDSCESSSDDEKGGTIKFKPKLRHVSTVKKPMSFDDDSEPEYHQLFEYVFVVGLKEKPKEKGKLTTELTYNFPPASDSAKKDIALQSIPQFCFPDVDQWKPVKEYKSESFSFVLTDVEGHRRYGYCRRLLPEGSGKRLPEVYCIVSPLGCFSLYEKILDNIEERRSMATAVSVFTFLKAIVANPFPRPGRSVEVPVISARGTGMETVVFERPMDSRLEHVDFSLLFNTLSQRKVIQVFSSLLMERRVILCAQSLSLISGCAHALLALLYPFEWQHVFIPVLPSSLIDFVCSPLPYIIGINPSCIKQIETMETMEEALIVDLDKKKFVRKIGDETSILPTKLFQYLEHSLSSTAVTGEYSKKSSDGTARSRADEVVVNTFMTFFAYLYGDYKSFMSVTNPATGEREFQRKDFLKQFSSKSTKRFLEAFQMTQMFENFIEQRENPSKASMVSESLFEKKFPELSRGCQEIEIFSSKSRFGRWKIKKGLASNS